MQPNTACYKRDEMNTAMKDMSFMGQIYSAESLYTNIQTQNAAVNQSQPNSRSRVCKVHVFYLRVECVRGTEAQYRAQLVMVFMSHVVVKSASLYSVRDS